MVSLMPLMPLTLLPAVRQLADAADITKQVRNPKTPRQNSRMPQQLRLDLRPGVSEPVVLLISRREVKAGDIASVPAFAPR